MNALMLRKVTERPLVISRSTFPYGGRAFGHSIQGAATWLAYRRSIAEQLAFVSIYQFPVVGADVCGYASETTEKLCTRWAMLGAFSSFYRNHADRGKTPQEFYRWPLVAEAARTAIDIRYRLLDYLYTAMEHQSRDGTPWMNALWFLYPHDAKTFGNDLQFFFGPSLLVSPVTEEDATDVSIYLPDDLFYDWYTHKSVRGQGASIMLNEVGFTTMPLHIKGGSIIPLRVTSANTTKLLRTKDFSILIAPGVDGSAKGNLYFDDGITHVQYAQKEIAFTFDGRTIHMTVLTFAYDPGVRIAEFVILGQREGPSRCYLNGIPIKSSNWNFNQTSGELTIRTNASFWNSLQVTIE